jgi:hypothetical protein
MYINMADIPFKKIKRGRRPKTSDPFEIPAKFDAMESYILTHKTELRESILDSIEVGLYNELSAVDVINFHESSYVISLREEEYLPNVRWIYDSYLDEESYELCERPLKLLQKYGKTQ